VKRRRRKQVPQADRQPLVRPQGPNEVWSADFVFDRTDRTAEGRVLKCLTIVDDATTEAVAAVPARALGGLAVTRVLDRLAITRGLPRVLRTDNALEFCGRAMLTWANDRGVTLRLIEPGKPNQNADIESFNGDFGTSVSTSTGSRACRMRRASSRRGDASTTTNDRRRRWAG
jgi:putative transposase